MFDRLRRGDERSIQNRFVLDLASDLFRLVEEAIDGGALHPLGSLPSSLKTCSRRVT
jgi:hypothetical protein